MSRHHYSHLAGERCKLNAWHYTCASCIGSNHKNSGEACQDSLAYYVDEEESIFLVADGAGSTKFGGQGAKHVCEFLVESLRGFSSGLEKEDLEIRLLNARTSLGEIARNANRNLQDYATTILGVLLSNGNAIGFQIGDGAIVYAIKEEDEFQLLTKPDQGSYPNETFFLTSENWKARLQFKTLETRINQFAMFTDGIQDLGIKHGVPPLPHHAFFRPFFEMMRTNSDPNQRQEIVESFLNSDRVCQRTGDDKTMIIACRNSDND